MSGRNRQRKKSRSGPLRVRVMAEYASSGLWLLRPCGVFRHSGLEWNGMLRLPPALSAGFAAWIEAYNALLQDAPFDYEGFNRVGRALAHRLKAHLGPESYVEFVPEAAETGLGQPEVIV